MLSKNFPKTGHLLYFDQIRSPMICAPSSSMASLSRQRARCASPTT
jgi:hypothetical protein